MRQSTSVADCADAPARDLEHAAFDASLLELLPLLRCPVEKTPLVYADAVLVSGSHTYPVRDQVIRLNPMPSDRALNAYYEEVNLRKAAPSLNSIQGDAFTFEGDNAEKYYRNSRKESLLDLVPKSLGVTLDVGGGGGEIFRSLLVHAGLVPEKLILMDWAAGQMASVAPSLASARNYFVQADALNIPMHDETADNIFNSEMIEHLLPEQS
ncbi:class I SAM-dependent methyltransferase [Arenibaculum sp.]|jgi:hypothetical protein|uniref:class I SAM-dependent methyltransferase n=1 Tax=Arenibaculum sp. TaxID=2865862 RepID=UPI002E120679|nr:methyltransferase domain-containing protein [Arenibaculum sp.]